MPLQHVRNGEQLACRELLQESAWVGTAKHQLLIAQQESTGEMGGFCRAGRAGCLHGPSQADWRLASIARARDQPGPGAAAAQVPAPLVVPPCPQHPLVPLTKHSLPDSATWNAWECNPRFIFQRCCTFSGCQLHQLQSASSKEGTEVSTQPHQNECALIVSDNYFTGAWIREVMTYQITEWAPACVNMAPKSLISVFLHPLYEFGMGFFICSCQNASCWQTRQSATKASFMSWLRTSEQTHTSLMCYISS